MKYGQNAASDKQRRKRQSVEARATIEAAKLIRERGTATAAGAWMACPALQGSKRHRVAQRASPGPAQPRTVANAARTSVAKISGCSNAAKWPPLDVRFQ